jgi:hypothetical protein
MLPVEPVQTRGISDPGFGKSLTVAVLLSHGRPSHQFPEPGQRSAMLAQQFLMNALIPDPSILAPTEHKISGAVYLSIRLA